MGLRVKDVIKKISPIAAGTNFSIELTVGGMLYHSLLFGLTGLSKADVQNVELVINGKPMRRYADLAELDAENDHYERAYPSGNSILYFERPELQEQFRQFTSLGTSDVTSLVITGTIAATVTGSPNIDVTYNAEKAVAPLGLFTKIREFSKTVSAAGEHALTDIIHKGQIAAITFKKSDVSRVKIEGVVAANGETKILLDATKEEIQGFQLNTRTPNANETKIDFLESGLINDTVAGQEFASMTITPTVDSAGAIPVRMEFIDSFAGV